eukprot:1254954-Rhodomonas_salina.1
MAGFGVLTIAVLFGVFCFRVFRLILIFLDQLDGGHQACQVVSFGACILHGVCGGGVNGKDVSGGPLLISEDVSGGTFFGQ